MSVPKRSFNIVAVIQGRMTSSRLPGKILMDIGGHPMLMRVVQRARRAHLVSQVVVATTGDPSDDAVESLCLKNGVPCYRGNLYDVLDRIYQVARLYTADIIVRITADCPLIDPNEIDHVIKSFIDQDVDFAANRLPPPWKRTYPIGLDTEVCSFAALEKAWREAKAPHQREHVMPYLYEDPGRFHVLILDSPVDYGSLRWTVDTPEDLEVIRRIYDHFGNRDDIPWLQIIEYYKQHPELIKMNANVNHNPFNAVDHRTGETP